MVSLGGLCRSHSTPGPWLGLAPISLTLEPGLFLLGFSSTSARKEDPVFLSGLTEMTCTLSLIPHYSYRMDEQAHSSRVPVCTHGLPSSLPLAPTPSPGEGRLCQRLPAPWLWVNHTCVNVERPGRRVAALRLPCVLVTSFGSPEGPRFLPLLTNHREALGT